MTIVDSGTTHGFRNRLIAVAGSVAILAGGIAGLAGCAASAPVAVPATVDAPTRAAATPAAPALVAAGRLTNAPALSMMSTTKTWPFPATADLDSRSKPTAGRRC